MTRPDARPNGRFRDDLINVAITVGLLLWIGLAANLLIGWIGL